MNKEILEELLSQAVHAPSGENTQPWRFEVTQDLRLSLYSIQSRDTSIYNLDNKGIFIDFGALIENIVILSTSYNFTAEVSLFPKMDDKSCVAEIIFKYSPQDRHPLIEYVLKRNSNREKFLPARLSEDFIETLKYQTKDNLSTQIHLTTNSSEIRTLSKALSVNDFLILHNNVIGKFFFSRIVWTKAKLAHRKIGFSLSTLGLDFFDRIGIRFLRISLFRRFSRLLFLPQYAAYKSAQKTATASLVGCITTILDTPEAYISVVRALQRTWLTVTKEGFAFQAFGVSMLHEALSPTRHFHIFDELEKDKINRMYKDIQDVYHLDKEIPCMVFRIGKAKNPVMKSEKMCPKIKYV